MLNIVFLDFILILIYYLHWATVLYHAKFVFLSYYNLAQNICRRFDSLAQILSTESETELNYYHEKVSVRVATRVAERLKT